MLMNKLPVVLLLSNILTYIHTQETKSKVACEFNSLSLECNENERLSIVEGNYGRRNESVCKNQENNNCINSDTVRILKEKCEGRVTCVVAASNDVFGDPCAYTEKYLEVSYKCKPVTKVQCKRGELNCDDGKCISNTRICDGYNDCSGGDDEVDCRYRTAYGCNYSDLKVECNEGELIRVMKGNYGRSSNVICQRSYHSNCNSSTAVTILKQRCNLLRTCSVPVSTDLFGDPCAHVLEKYIEMQYACWTIPENFY
ncbi:Calcium-independent receptor for alpha-latrotoxin [Carabus blaptoides fortunei]